MCLFANKSKKEGKHRKQKRVKVFLQDNKKETKAQKKRRERALKELGR